MVCALFLEWKCGLKKEDVDRDVNAGWKMEGIESRDQDYRRWLSGMFKKVRERREQIDASNTCRSERKTSEWAKKKWREKRKNGGVEMKQLKKMNGEETEGRRRDEKVKRTKSLPQKVICKKKKKRCTHAVSS